MPGTGWPGPTSATSPGSDHHSVLDSHFDSGRDEPDEEPAEEFVQGAGDGLGAESAAPSAAQSAAPLAVRGGGRGSGRVGVPVARGRGGWDHEADRWLVEQAVAGHGQAFEVLLRRHQDRIYGIALRMTGDTTAAEDVAQEVAIQLWRVLATFTGASMFTTWLYRIVVNRCLNHQRAARVVGRSARPLLESEHPSTTGPEQRAVDAARLDAATAALAGLAPEQRAALVLCQIEGLSYREAATITNISEPALRSRLERGRKNLLAAMQEWV